MCSTPIVCNVTWQMVAIRASMGIPLEFYFLCSHANFLSLALNAHSSVEGGGEKIELLTAMLRRAAALMSAVDAGTAPADGRAAAFSKLMEYQQVPGTYHTHSSM